MMKMLVSAIEILSGYAQTLDVRYILVVLEQMFRYVKESEASQDGLVAMLAKTEEKALDYLKTLYATERRCVEYIEALANKEQEIKDLKEQLNTTKRLGNLGVEKLNGIVDRIENYEDDKKSPFGPTAAQILNEVKEVALGLRAPKD